jgi:heme A synthase
MNKIFEFFNKIMGLMIFVIIILLAVSFIHRGHHGHRWHHRHFEDSHEQKDSVIKSSMDTLGRK